MIKFRMCCGSKKAQGLPVNVVVMLILGIIIFGLGLGLFYNISNESEDIVGDLNNQIKTDIADLECDGGEWICSPNYEMENGEVGKFSVFIANHASSTKDFSISVGDGSQPFFLEKTDCSANIYFATMKIKVKPGESAKIPFIVKDLKTSSGCTLITTVELFENGISSGKKASIKVRVK